MKFRVSSPEVPGKYFTVEAKDSLWAIMVALNPTVWNEQQWESVPESLKAEFQEIKQ